MTNKIEDTLKQKILDKKVTYIGYKQNEIIIILENGTELKIKNNDNGNIQVDYSYYEIIYGTINL